jgi:transcriptional regulator with XRE-family HTH domain
MPQRLGDWIREVRIAKGQTQQQAAQGLGVSRMQFSSWEKGAYVPKIPTLFRIADWGGVKIDDLRQMFS